MTATIIITGHASERIEQRLAPTLGADARAVVEEIVLDAVWNRRFRRAAPRWSRCLAKVRSDEVRYACGVVDGVRIAAVVALGDASRPVLVTVLTDAPEALGPLPPVPVLADGRTIGLPRAGRLPIAFQVAA